MTDPKHIDHPQHRPQHCGKGVCAAMEGHEGTCDEASGWISDEQIDAVVVSSMAPQNRAWLIEAILATGGAAAMLDALTRHGVLSEEAHRRCTGCGATDSRDVPFILSHFMHDMDATTEDAPEVVERRLVTPWEVQP